ncbi:hypothetical protein Poli38472_002391 [Pythium oligandrum]|uniref:Uncharacterized protein n=1 Tax=Pythium oligandrum TaxID=41045 RepID=A0A8K1FH32_PYTOL|nr:hypothetical protein Poli38472_002391 [Pythium oligandrum]|eukprot:TMW63450.1 hypothetical protein Poli38472_002391 [Pythium oligandrum]
MARRTPARSSEEEEDVVSNSESESVGSSGSGGSSDDEASGEDESTSDEEEDEEDKAVAKHALVENDLMEVRKMIEEMERIKARLQFRLSRERENGSISSPPTRRASVEDIIVPPTVSAAVQTNWDMTKMFEVEKVVSSPEIPPPQVAPINKTAQLSMEDLAQSYGMERLRKPTLPTISSDDLRTPPPYNSVSQLDEAIGKQTNPLDTLATQDSHMNGTGRSKPDTIQYTSPRESSFTDPFGTSVNPPASPMNPAHERSDRRGPQELAPGLKQEKTTAQKEMEAIRSLLF